MGDTTETRVQDLQRRANQALRVLARPFTAEELVNLEGARQRAQEWVDAQKAKAEAEARAAQEAEAARVRAAVDLAREATVQEVWADIARIRGRLRGSPQFTYKHLEDYYGADFDQGCDFVPGKHGWKMVEAAKAGAAYIKADKQGAPQLYARMVDDWMDRSFDLVVPYEEMNRLYIGVKNLTGRADGRFAHAALKWWAFTRKQGVNLQAFAYEHKVDPKQVKRWLKYALQDIERKLKSVRDPNDPA